LNCAVDRILQEVYILFLTRFRTYKIAAPTQTKMTIKYDIKGLVSLKFLHPWCVRNWRNEIRKFRKASMGKLSSRGKIEFSLPPMIL